MRIKLLIALFTMLALLLPGISAANSGSMKLLAVSEIDEGVYRGSIADLTLEIREGSGRVFVNTFPISKLDTQISMRFAKQIACKHTGADCSKSDFIYTLTASSGIVGGPSAGAAAAVLTTALLENLNLRRDIAITGTINSGELIGPVGGLKAKIDAASNGRIKKVLIPKGESVLKNDSEEIDLTEYSEELGVEVVEVSTLGEALFYFTGRKNEKPKEELTVDEEYKNIMKSLAMLLCNRSSELQEKYLSSKPENHVTDSILEFEKSGINETEKARSSFEAGDYYTAASFCFRANIDYMYLWNYMQNFSSSEIREKAEALDEEISDFEEYIEGIDIQTLTDLQAYMITKERIDGAKERKNTALNRINNTDSASYWLAFSKERLFSAFSWSHFFGAGSREFRLDNITLRKTCEIKISEAEERYQYVNFYFPSTLSETRKEIDKAKLDRQSGNYIMCLYKASRAKAQANVVLGIIGVDEEMLGEMLSQKIEAAEQIIIEQQKLGIFPIMGYSYYEYAVSLKEEEDASSAMIYAEYALELSNFDFYFEKTGKGFIPISGIDYRLLAVLIIGVCIGYLIGIKIRKPVKPEKRKADSGVRIIRAKKPKRKKTAYG